MIVSILGLSLGAVLGLSVGVVAGLSMGAVAGLSVGVKMGVKMGALLGCLVAIAVVVFSDSTILQLSGAAAQQAPVIRHCIMRQIAPKNKACFKIVTQLLMTGGC